MGYSTNDPPEAASGRLPPGGAISGPAKPVPRWPLIKMAAHLLSVRQYGASHGSHSHDHFQVLVGLEGELELEVAGRGRRIGAGDGWVVPPGERHDFEALNGSRCLVLDTAQPAWSRCVTQPAQTAQTLALAQYLAGALQSGQPHAVHYGPLLLLEAWGVTSAARSRRRIDWPALSAWARARWHGALDVAELAAQVHLSPTQFAARCRQETGQSPMQWLRGQRLAHARALRLGGLAVAEAARRTGYRSPSALTAALRREGR
jgi:AraC-like DNA-binding protein/mannose-6-phosphate isomerase-like protein (cupin superfamily)